MREVDTKFLTELQEVATAHAVALMEALQELFQKHGMAPEKKSTHELTTALIMGLSLHLGAIVAGIRSAKGDISDDTAELIYNITGMFITRLLSDDIVDLKLAYEAAKEMLEQDESEENSIDGSLN